MNIPAASRGIPRTPLRDSLWDGRRLKLIFDPPLTHGSDIALELDGCHFAISRSDADAQAGFDFPFSPSGNAAMRVLPRLGRDGPAILDAPLKFSFGVAGLTASNDLPNALTPLEDGQLLPLGSDCASPEVVIVVPIYNATEHVERCLASLLAHTRGNACLVLIDDASSEPGIAALLEQHAGMSGIRVLRNPRNLGFTANANRGLAAAGHADVVLLNADTEVGPNWLSGLRRAAYARDDTGSATAVSDNAGAFSVPELEQTNDLPDCWTTSASARALWQHAGIAYPELPTGNGFCMYLKRAMLDEVGVFDEAAFPRGYGEENDLCQRARARGWHHVIAGNVLVAHARSQSFGESQRLALGQVGMAVLRDRYPDYEAQVAATLYSFERLVLDWRVRRIFSDARSNNVPLPRMLWFGGSRPTATDWEVWLVRHEGDSLILQGPSRPGTEPSITRVAPTVATSDSQVQALWTWLQVWAFECVVVGSDDHFGLASMARALDIPTFYPDKTDVNAPTYADCAAASRSFAGNSS